MKTKTKIKAGPGRPLPYEEGQHNETVVRRGLKVKTKIKAGPFHPPLPGEQSQHNETLVRRAQR